MTRHRWMWAAGGAVLAACTGLGLLGGGGDTIRFDHARHQKVDCATCHNGVYASWTLQEPPEEAYFPAESTCLQCHKERKERNDCAYCHTNVEKAAAWTQKTYTLKLSHEDHLRYTEGDCLRCHLTLSGSNAPAAPPPMATCNSCHQKTFDQGRCDFCHLDLAKYPLQPITSFSHGEEFVRQHAAPARANVASCTTCHDQTFCAGCHAANTTAGGLELSFPERTDRAFIHRADFVSRHAIEARSDQASCKKCHGNATCESCHTAQNLTPSGANPINPHPPGWAFPGGGHGAAARQDIASCAACHDQGASSNCVECHRTGGVGGNPHPPGWTQRHPRGEIQKNGMCLSCHL